MQPHPREHHRPVGPAHIVQPPRARRVGLQVHAPIRVAGGRAALGVAAALAGAQLVQAAAGQLAVEPECFCSIVC